MSPLVTADDLQSFPGAPFDDALVDVAAASVRAEAGWHIAPVVTQTLYLQSFGGRFVTLPSRRVVSISAVRSGATTYTDWTLEPGRLYRPGYYYGGWPVGVIEVDLVHGYDEVPADLLPVIVNRVRNAGNVRDPGVQQRSTTRGPFSESETYRDGGITTDPTVARYALLAGVA